MPLVPWDSPPAKEAQHCADCCNHMCHSCWRAVWIRSEIVPDVLVPGCQLYETYPSEAGSFYAIPRVMTTPGTCCALSRPGLTPRRAVTIAHGFIITLPRNRESEVLGQVMKVFILHCSPDARSLISSLKEFTVQRLEAAGHEVRVSDLYGEPPFFHLALMNNFGDLSPLI